MLEQFANGAQSQLTSPMTSGQGSLVLASASNFPSVGNYRVLVDGEVMLCTSRSGTTLSLSRAVDGTIAASHAAGALAACVLTAASLLSVVTDRALMIANNLSDVANVYAAQTNLGLSFAVESFGGGPGLSETTNTMAWQAALNAASANGGGVVSALHKGTWAVTPILTVWPNTTIRIGAGVVIQNAQPGVYTGMVFGNGSYNGLTPTATASGASATFTIAGLSSTPPYAANALVGAAGVIYNTTDSTSTNWIPNLYNVVANNGTTVTFDRVCTTAPSTGTFYGSIGYSMFRDGAAEQTSPVRSDSIRFEGPGTIDMANSGESDPIGWFTRAIWLRKVSNWSIAEDLNIINCALYATMINDSTDFTVDGLIFDTRRDGLHFTGPINGHWTIRDVSGTNEDNKIAFIIGDSRTTYPIQGHPFYVFGNVLGSGAILNITAEGDYNPIRICGSSSYTIENISIDGLHGSMWSGASGLGIHAVTYVNDGPDLTGLVMNHMSVRNVDIVLQNASANTIYVESSGIKSLRVNDITLNGTGNTALQLDVYDNLSSLFVNDMLVAPSNGKQVASGLRLMVNGNTNGSNFAPMVIGACQDEPTTFAGIWVGWTITPFPETINCVVMSNGADGYFCAPDPGGTLYLRIGSTVRASVKPSGQINLVPLTSAPSGAEGDAYYDSTLHKLRIHTASGWETVTSA